MFECLQSDLFFCCCSSKKKENLAAFSWCIRKLMQETGSGGSVENGR